MPLPSDLDRLGDLIAALRGRIEADQPTGEICGAARDVALMALLIADQVETNAQALEDGRG